jgi:alpha-ribazole phosphatase
VRPITRLILIRHGQTEWNVEGRWQGQSDPPLNAEGIAQAHRLGADLTNKGLDVIYTSSLLRAVETAQIVAHALGLPLKVEPRLVEIHQGDWDAHLRSEIAQAYPDLLRQWEADPWARTPPGGERLEDVQRRVYAALDDILSEEPDRCVALVTHRLPIFLIKMRYQGLDPDMVRVFELPNAYREEIVVPGKQQEAAG